MSNQSVQAVGTLVATAVKGTESGVRIRVHSVRFPALERSLAGQRNVGGGTGCAGALADAPGLA